VEKNGLDMVLMGSLCLYVWAHVDLVVCIWICSCHKWQQ